LLRNDVRSARDFYSACTIFANVLAKIESQPKAKLDYS
jgi:hypothetical protein